MDIFWNHTIIKIKIKSIKASSFLLSTENEYKHFEHLADTW